MKLHLHTESSQHAITGHGDGYVAVNGREIRVPLAVSGTSLIEPWLFAPPSPSAEDFLGLIERAEQKPSLIVFGTGKRFSLPAPAVMAALYAHGIGFEAMDTAAACRTYSVLTSEGRAVLAALLV